MSQASGSVAGNGIDSVGARRLNARGLVDEVHQILHSGCVGDRERLGGERAASFLAGERQRAGLERAGVIHAIERLHIDQRGIRRNLRAIEMSARNPAHSSW